MERNSQSSKGLEWEILSVYGEKPIEIHEKVGYFMCSSSSDVGLYGNEFGSCSFSTNTVSSSIESATTDDYGKFSSLPQYRSTNEDITRIQDISGTTSYSEASIFSSEPMNIGLNLGRQREYEDNFSSVRTKNTVSSLPISSSTATTTTKRSRAFYQNMHNPCCQVEGCNLDLTSAKDYHRRHRICESHSKSPMVIVAGMERRFCQQCSRFHELSEFDDKKRSCRRRLSDHNARRRRMPSESIHLSSSAFYDGRPHNAVFNAFPIPVLNQALENPSTSIIKQDRDSDSFIRTSNGNGTVCLPGLHLDSQIQSINIPHQYSLHTPTTNSSVISQDVPSAHSLLSSNNNPWSIVSNSMECVVNANYNPERSDLEPNNWTVFPSNNNVSTEQVMSPVHNPGTTQFQLFNTCTPHHSPSFYSNHRNF